jgi:hypothetical protein
MCHKLQLKLLKLRNCKINCNITPKAHTFGSLITNPVIHSYLIHSNRKPHLYKSNHKKKDYEKTKVYNRYSGISNSSDRSPGGHKSYNRCCNGCPNVHLKFRLCMNMASKHRHECWIQPSMLSLLTYLPA